jgi:PhnB protein
MLSDPEGKLHGMADSSKVMRAAAITGRGSSLNPFAIIADAAGFIEFATSVFGAVENTVARTATPSGLLIHAEVELGDSLLLLSDPQAGWPERPGLFQLWISDLAAILDLAAGQGATVVTPPTPFYGAVTLARLQDRWKNLWWLYQPEPGQPDPVPVWEGGSDVVFRTLDEHMRSLIG